jgi:DNA-binding XRE family transcriptional regulator
MELRNYIKNVRKISIERAAEEIGISRQHMNKLCLRQGGPSLKLASKIILWSHGNITIFDLNNFKKKGKK